VEVISKDRDGDDELTDVLAQVSVMLRVCPTDGTHSTVLNVDARSRQVVLQNPTAGGATAGHVTAQRHISPPKMFAFDAVFTPNDCLVCFFLYSATRTDFFAHFYCRWFWTRLGVIILQLLIGGLCCTQPVLLHRIQLTAYSLCGAVSTDATL